MKTKPTSPETPAAELKRLEAELDTLRARSTTLLQRQIDAMKIRQTTAEYNTVMDRWNTVEARIRELKAMAIPRWKT